MLRRPPRSTLSDTLFPYPTPFLSTRSIRQAFAAGSRGAAARTPVVPSSGYRELPRHPVLPHFVSPLPDASWRGCLLGSDTWLHCIGLGWGFAWLGWHGASVSFVCKTRRACWCGFSGRHLTMRSSRHRFVTPSTWQVQLAMCLASLSGAA